MKSEYKINTTNLYYSFNESICFYISGYNHPSGAISDICEYLTNWEKTLQPIAKDQQICTLLIKNSLRFAGVRVFYFYSKTPPDYSMIIQQSMLEFLHN